MHRRETGGDKRLKLGLQQITKCYFDSDTADHMISLIT